MILKCFPATDNHSVGLSRSYMSCVCCYLRVPCWDVWSRLSTSVSVWQQGNVRPCERSLYLSGGMDRDLLWEA